MISKEILEAPQIYHLIEIDLCFLSIISIVTILHLIEESDEMLRIRVYNTLREKMMHELYN
jgi:hypothetical protein